jgi:hypothetical protein
MTKPSSITWTKWQPWHIVFGLPAVFLGLVFLLSGLGIVDSSWAQSCFAKRCGTNSPRYPFSLTTLVGVGAGLIALGLPTLLGWAKPLQALLRWSFVLALAGFLFACVAYFFQPQPAFLGGRFNEPVAMFAVILSLVLLASIFLIVKTKNGE